MQLFSDKYQRTKIFLMIIQRHLLGEFLDKSDFFATGSASVVLDVVAKQ